MVNLCRIGLLLLSGLLSCSLLSVSLICKETPAAVSKEAAESCGRKLLELEEFSANRAVVRDKKTHFYEDEVNSYISLDLRSQFHPSLKSLVLKFEENRLQAVAAIDFDRLSSASSTLLTRLITAMFSGTHTLTLHGQLQSQNGKAHLQLEEAFFDDRELPKPLIEEIITLVGRQQDPPFNPLEPSELPYDIKRVFVHAGHIAVYQ